MMTTQRYTLNQIANILLINFQQTENAGLLNGQLGIALFFCHYSRYIGEDAYGKIANLYIEEVYGAINPEQRKDFGEGLAGVCWLADHLAREGFIEADDDALGDMDELIMSMEQKDFLKELDNEIPLFSKGIYFTWRDNPDNIKRTLENGYAFFENAQLPCLSIGYINSVLFLILGAVKRGIEPELCVKFLDRLYPHTAQAISLEGCCRYDLLMLRQYVTQIGICGENWDRLVSCNAVSNEPLSVDEWRNYLFDSPGEQLSAHSVNSFIEENICDLEDGDKMTAFKGLAGMGLNILKQL